MAVTKSIISNLNQGDKLNNKNYYVWNCKIQYLLEEQDMLETIIQLMAELEHGNTFSIGEIWKHIKPISAKIELLAY